jgi:NO-binding membrane sensor protein with MHYT domain
MLAYQPGVPLGYDLFGTMLSVVAAILITGFGWAVALADRRGATVAGGVLIGGGIATMHYIGMASLNVAGRLVWDEGLVALSLGIGSLLSVAAMTSYRRIGGANPLRASLLLAGAICSLHFLAMSAGTIYPDPRIVVPLETMDSHALAAMVAMAALLILIISFGVVMFDRRLAQAQVEEAQRSKALADAVIAGGEERDRLTAELKRQADISHAALENMGQGLSMFDAEDRLVTFRSICWSPEPMCTI